MGIAVQADRKLVISGYANADPLLMRLNPDGSDDPAFDSPSGQRQRQVHHQCQRHRQ